MTAFKPHHSRTALQAAVFLGGFVPVLVGGYGALRGAAWFSSPAIEVLDSHVRYLSGLLLSIGLLFWSFIPHIERRATPVRILTIVVVGGGLCRLLGVLATGMLSTPSLLALGMELVVTPLLCLWQGRVASHHTLMA